MLHDRESSSLLPVAATNSGNWLERTAFVKFISITPLPSVKTILLRSLSTMAQASFNIDRVQGISNARPLY
jgi:hypothetical protein